MKNQKIKNQNSSALVLNNSLISQQFISDYSVNTACFVSSNQKNNVIALRQTLKEAI